MYVTVCKKAMFSTDDGGFVPPAYVGSRLTEAVAAAIRIAKTADFAGVYVMADGKDYGPDPQKDLKPAMTCWFLNPETLKFEFDGSETVPIEFYRRGFPEIDALYETQNPRP